MSPDNAEVFFKVLPEADLPIFSGRLDDLTLFYAPGYLAAARDKEAEEIRLILAGEIPFGNPAAGHLISAAGSARAEWWRIHQPENYQPTCLTIYSSAECNLDCTYCFAKASHDHRLKLSDDLILAAARSVIDNCAEQKVPFAVVFHGGGEPTLDLRLRKILQELRGMSSDAAVGFRSYIATNGVMSEEAARWMAENFEEIGLSVDGPPEIQNAQRPMISGTPTSEIVERTAAIIRQIRGKLSVRVTLLPENFSRLSEIAAYLYDTMKVDEIHVEPVYHHNTPPESADEFCENYLNLLRQAGPKLTFSGTRNGEIHGRYCQIFRRVLHLVPPGGCSVCFALSTQEEAARKGLDQPEDDEVFELLSREDPGCRDCFNYYHCARGCPDVCPASSPDFRDAGSFRCRISRTLAEAGLLDRAKRLLAETARQYGFAGMNLRGG